MHFQIFLLATCSWQWLYSN